MRRPVGHVRFQRPEPVHLFYQRRPPGCPQMGYKAKGRADQRHPARCRAFRHRPGAGPVCGGRVKTALLRLNYVSQTNHVCMAGIMKLGESAEETVIREVGEELGLKVKCVEFVKSYPYEKKEMPTPQRLRSWLVPRPSQKSLRPKARGQVSGGYCGGFWQWTRCQSL